MHSAKLGTPYSDTFFLYVKLSCDREVGLEECGGDNWEEADCKGAPAGRREEGKREGGGGERGRRNRRKGGGWEKHGYSHNLGNIEKTLGREATYEDIHGRLD